MVASGKLDRHAQRRNLWRNAMREQPARMGLSTQIPEPRSTSTGLHDDSNESRGSKRGSILKLNPHYSSPEWFHRNDHSYGHSSCRLDVRLDQLQHYYRVRHCDTIVQLERCGNLPTHRNRDQRSFSPRHNCYIQLPRLSTQRHLTLGRLSRILISLYNFPNCDKRVRRNNYNHRYSSLSVNLRLFELRQRGWFWNCDPFL
jgi:hypothetical protein